MSEGKSLNFWALLAQVHRIVGKAKYQILHVACQVQSLVPKWLLETAGRIMDLAAWGGKSIQRDSGRFCTTDRAFKGGAEWAGASENNGLSPQMKPSFCSLSLTWSPTLPRSKSMGICWVADSLIPELCLLVQSMFSHRESASLSIQLPLPWSFEFPTKSQTCLYLSLGTGDPARPKGI